MAQLDRAVAPSCGQEESARAGVNLGHRLWVLSTLHTACYPASSWPLLESIRNLSSQETLDLGFCSLGVPGSKAT